MKRIYSYIVIICVIFSIFFIPSSGTAQLIEDYTAYPPFLPSGTAPNLLLMIDNSGSMYDIAYIDKGAPSREPSYCYDQTYAGTNVYEGYFDRDTVYTYNQTNQQFEASSFSSSCSNKIAGELCVDIMSGTPGIVLEFTARGNYLNWLATSKFDLQKKILTGGKYDTFSNEIQSETRGCEGKRFLKEALTADYVEGGTNTSLGITFAITGEPNPYNSMAPSPGGQTYIEIFEGDFGEKECQTAIRKKRRKNNSNTNRRHLQECLSYDPYKGSGPKGSRYCLLDPTLTCTSDSDCDTIDEAGSCSSNICNNSQMLGESCETNEDCNTYTSVGPCGDSSSRKTRCHSKIMYILSRNECQEIRGGYKKGSGRHGWQSEGPKCAELYSRYRICSGGVNDGNTCTDNTDCTGGTCIGGPSAIRQGHPAYMCSDKYVGYCATTNDNWATTTWGTKGKGSKMDCFTIKYDEFCSAVTVPEIIDPSYTTDESVNTINVPALISDIGVEAQLGAPLIKMKVNINTTAPTGLINDYKDSIRFGVMKFNFNGSKDECNLSSTDKLSCPKICSSAGNACNTNSDCPSGDTCASTSTNKDASLIVNYIGEGYCSVSGAACVRDDQCPTGETCDATVGDHSSGLIHDIDEIKANTWTPLAEAYYNAIAYFVNGAKLYSPINNAIWEPLKYTDTFTAGKNPIELSCQKNNILIISDGGSTADLNSDMTSKVKSLLFNDGDTNDPSSCGGYFGSTYLDDLSYYSYNKNIFDPSDSNRDDDDAAQSITTYVVYTGSGSSTTGDECEALTLMQNTAANGGTTLYNPENPADLAAALKNVLNTVMSGTASGSSVGLLSTKGNGSGAIYQAYFNPEPDPDRKWLKWFGYLHALFIDEYGNIREDTVEDNTLDLTKDYIIEMKYTVDPDDSTKKKTLVHKYADSDGDGIKDSSTPAAIVTLDEITSLWRAGRQLAERPADNRDIFTSTNGYTSLDFNSINNLNQLKPWLRVTDDVEAKAIIDWTRGADVIGYRQRDIAINGGSPNIWKLGDIIYSTPTAVGAPKENFDFRYGDETYYEFETAKSKRLEVVYVGANDGMLHAFNAGCYDTDASRYYSAVNSDGKCMDSTAQPLGQELWAYIPRGMLPHLKWYTMPDYTHVYGVDLKPKVTDVKIFKSSTHVREWGTILIGGYRYGGKNISWTEGDAKPEYFALDITNPPAKKVLWTFTDNDLGLTMSYPSVAKVGDKWYAIFGSGPTTYDSDSNITASKPGYVFILDLSSGNDGVINTWTINGNYWKIPTPTGKSASFMSDSVAVDRDIIDYSTDVIYIGENYDNGTSWSSRMLRIPTNTNPSSWKSSSVLNVADVAGSSDDISRHISTSPAVSSDDRGNVWLYFGTGRFLGKKDKNHNDTGAMYAVKDGCWNGKCTNSYSGLIDISGAEVKIDGTVSGIGSTCYNKTINTWYSLTDAVNSCDGWVMYFKTRTENADFTGETLQRDGERMISRPVVIGGIVAWATYIPGIEECEDLGESNAYAVHYKSGTAYKDYLFKAQREQSTSPGDPIARVINLGEGMPATPSVKITEEGKAKLIISTSTGAIETLESELPLLLESGSAAWTINHIP